ncbi:sugar phosphate nucleotidyltransferase [bacterium]|nr:sugar phosphate nucleotidyltransferase [bacterium]
MTTPSKLPSNVYAVILAGGSGTRFWPKSRRKTPKQLCKIGRSEKTMIEITLERLSGFIDPENRIIVTHKDQAELTRKIVGDTCPNVLAEPEARQTTAALALGAIAVEELHAKRGIKEKPVMISLHADHVIKKVDAFKQALTDAVVLAEQDKLCLLGITPTRPDTGFGYLEKGSAIKDSNGFTVNSFREKPDLRTAKGFLAKKNFFWNAGLFIWRTEKILSEIKHFLPQTTEALGSAKEAIGGLLNSTPEQLDPYYSKLQKIAIDHAILEVSADVSVVEADIDWQDVGTWSALDQTFTADENGNLIFTDAIAIDCNNTTIDGDGPLIAALGLHDLIIVGMKDAVMVAPKERAQDVKLFVDKLKKDKREELY